MPQRRRGQSVLAKVERDRQMVGLHTEYPAFGWNENKGYGTAAHKDALRACRSHPVPPGQLAAALRLSRGPMAAWRAAGARWCKMEP